MESKVCWVLPGLISRRRRMGMRRLQGVGFILWEGSILDLGGKIGKKLNLWAPVWLGRKGEENVEKCPDGVWISLSSLEKEGRLLQRGLTHQKAQKRSAKVCKTSFRQGCFITWVLLNTQVCTQVQTHFMVHFQTLCQLRNAHNSDEL